MSIPITNPKSAKMKTPHVARGTVSFPGPPSIVANTGARKKKFDPKLLWASPEAYSLSLARHQENWAAIMGGILNAARSLQLKLDAEQEVMDLTPLERHVLSLANRRKTSSGPNGPKSPSEALKALLGFVIPILGKYATDVALQWLNAEIKYVYTSISGTVTSTSGYTLLNGIAQGTDYNQRVGNSIRLLGFDFRGHVTCNGSGSIAQLIRVIIGIDLQSDGALPTDTQLAEGGVLTVDVPVPSVLKAPDRFALFYDRVMTLSTTVQTAHVLSERLDNLVANNVHTLFDLTTGVIGAISRGALFCAMVSDQAANPPTVSLNLRVFYEDT